MTIYRSLVSLHSKGGKRLRDIDKLILGVKANPPSMMAVKYLLKKVMIQHKCISLVAHLEDCGLKYVHSEHAEGYTSECSGGDYTLEEFFSLMGDSFYFLTDEGAMGIKFMFVDNKISWQRIYET